MPNDAIDPEQFARADYGFNTTHWSVVIAAGEMDSALAHAALEELCRTYWFPLYAYVRRRGSNPHEAQDLTQEFFLRLLDKQSLRFADSTRGKFRSFLLTSLKNFLINEWEKTRAAKRGSGQAIQPLEFDDAERRYLAEPASDLTPERLFEKRWAVALVERAQDRLRAEYAAADKLVLFDQLKEQVWGERAETYSELASRLKTTEGALRIAAHRMKDRFRTLLREEVAHTAASADEIDAELRYLVFCASLKSIDVDALNPAYSSAAGVLFDKNQTFLIQYPAGRPGTDYSIPDSVAGIGTNAFWGCTGLSDVTIPASVTNVAAQAFVAPSSVASIMVDASNPVFSSVGGVFFNKGRTRLIQYPAANSASDYIVPAGVTSIGSHAFDHCILNNITLPNGVTNIEEWAFYYSLNLATVNVPISVQYIGRSAFSVCSALTSVNIPNGVPRILIDTFGNCYSLTNLVIPDSVTSIDEFACAGCGGLTEIVIGRGVTNIGEQAFSGCSLLGSLTIPSNVVTIGNAAFTGCGPTNLVIANGVRSIGAGAFNGNSGLTTVSIPPSVTNLGYGAFTACTYLTAIDVDAANPAYESVDGVLFNKSHTVLVEYPLGKSGHDYTIPPGVVIIGAHAFDSLGLTNVSIPNSVTSIGDYAFSYCYSLTNVVFPPGLTNIGNGAFWNCGIISAVLPEGITEIAPSTFGRSYLRNIVIPNSVTNIVDSAFYGCSDLGFVTIPDSVKHIGWLAFSSGGLYTLTIGNGVTSIGDSAFSYSAVSRIFFRGDVPNFESPYVFYSSAPTLYYLPGTIGWSATVADRPAEPWLLPNPQILTRSPSFGVRTNAFGFRVSWATNASVVLEACTNLAAPSWLPLKTNTLVNGWSYFSDPQWNSHPNRIYRVRKL